MTITLEVEHEGHWTPRPRQEVEREFASVQPGELTLDRALRHPDLPAIVRALTARGALVRLRVRNERVTRALSAHLHELGVVGIEVELEGLERLHDRVHGPGSWRGRVGSLRAARESRLGARARVRLDFSVVHELPELLPLLDALATDVVLAEAGPLDERERERVIAHGARLERLDFEGFALHGPPPQGAPIPIENSHWHAFSRGVRIPRAESGTLARTSTELSATIAKAGDLRRLGRVLEAMGAPAIDLPLCLGGRGRAEEPTLHVAACLPCPVHARCNGIPAELATDTEGLLQPRGRWRPLAAGACIDVAPARDEQLSKLTIPPLVARLEALGFVVTREGGHAGADLAVVWDFAQALETIDRGELRPHARVVVGDFHMLEGRPALMQRTAAGWPDARIEVVSAYPSFIHLYMRSRVPIDRMSFRPWPIGPLEPRGELRAGFAGGRDLADWELIAAVGERLGREGPAIRVAHGAHLRPARVGKLEPLGALSFDALVDAVATARFVVVATAWNRHLSTNSMLIALALACGRPIVATRTPVPDHLREGVDSLLVDPGDVEALAGAILRLDRDDVLRRRLAEGARRRGRLGSAAAWADELARGAIPPSELDLRAWP